jgi:hypothetical protein
MNIVGRAWFLDWFSMCVVTCMACGSGLAEAQGQSLVRQSEPHAQVIATDNERFAAGDETDLYNGGSSMLAALRASGAHDLHCGQDVQARVVQSSGRHAESLYMADGRHAP